MLIFLYLKRERNASVCNKVRIMDVTKGLWFLSQRKYSSGTDTNLLCTSTHISAGFCRPGLLGWEQTLVPPRPTLPALESMAVSQSWEQGSFTRQCLGKKDAVKPLRPLCLWALQFVSLHSHQHLSGFKAHGNSFQLLALLQVAEEAGRIIPPSPAPQLIQILSTFSRHWRGCLGIQRWPQLLRTQVHRFYCMLLHCASQILYFFQTEGVWQSCLKQVYRHHFPNGICSLFISVWHFGNFLIFQTFSVVSYLLYWSLVIFDVPTMTQKLTWWSAFFFSNLDIILFHT